MRIPNSQFGAKSPTGSWPNHLTNYENNKKDYIYSSPTTDDDANISL